MHHPPHPSDHDDDGDGDGDEDDHEDDHGKQEEVVNEDIQRHRSTRRPHPANDSIDVSNSRVK